MNVPPLDAHAHVKPAIPASDLQALNAAVIAVTRSLDEYEQVAGRTDRSTAWGVGLHPSVPEALAGFSEDRFAAAAKSAVIVGEVGLDGRAKTDRSEQRRVLRSIFEILIDTPRPVSVHSVSATADVMNILEEMRPRAVILHWWRGDETQTRLAVELGCWFSVNGAEIACPRILDHIPAERILTETDFPFSRRADAAARIPGAVGTTEAALAKRWGRDLAGVRRQIWRNLSDLYDQADPALVLPRTFEIAMAMT